MQKATKKLLLKLTEHCERSSNTNIVAKIDINIISKIKNGQPQLKIYWFKKRQCILAKNAKIWWCDRKDKRRRFYDDPDRMIWVQPAPWSLCCVLGQDALR